MKPSELSEAAREEIYMGWTKGEYQSYQGNVCAIGAVERVAMQNMAIAEAGIVQDELNKKTKEMFGAQFNRVQEFNDARDTRHEDMLALFDKVTLFLQEQGR